MKKICITMCIATTLIFTGCSKSESTFDKAMSEGKLALASQEYEKAEGMFELAVQENKDDKEANGLYNQTIMLIDAKKLIDEEKFEEAESILKELKDIESDSDSLKKEADKLIEDIKSSKNVEKKEEVEEVKKDIQPKKEVEKVTKDENTNKTLCSCGKNYLEDNDFWVGEDKCDDCINEVVNAQADNYGCDVCGNRTEELCYEDECAPLCEEHQYGENCIGGI